MLGAFVSLIINWMVHGALKAHDMHHLNVAAVAYAAAAAAAAASSSADAAAVAARVGDCFICV
jgi:hypothetical protein